MKQRHLAVQQQVDFVNLAMNLADQTLVLHKYQDSNEFL
jgi:hypothetical protein